MSFFLKQNIKAEPTINHWYAWALLISPVTHTLIATKHQIPILKSYIHSPELHAQAVSEPTMRGGPFIDSRGEDKSEQMQKILASTLSAHQELVQFSKSIKELDALLVKKARGDSLEALYEELPPELAGYVELFYNLNNNPGFRILEPLIYQSKFFNPSSQRILLSETSSDDRPFMLSTPIVPSKKHVVIQQPFSLPLYDELFSWRNHPVKEAELDKFCKNFIAPEQKKAFLGYFTTVPTEKKTSYDNGSNIRIRYFGHACILVEAAGISILIDPLISYAYETELKRYTFSDLPDIIDYALITHTHQDHFVIETLLQIKHKVKRIIVPKNNKGNLADPSLRLICEKLGFSCCMELDELETIKLPCGRITGIPFLGEHGDLNIYSKLGYVIELFEKTILCAADSNNLDNKMYERIQEHIPKIDVSFIGMECEGAPLLWLYGPMLPVNLEQSAAQSRRLDGSNAEKAFALISTFDCKQTYVYAMGQEPWLSFMTNIEYDEQSKPIVESNKLLDFCKACDIKAERLYGQKELYI